MKLSVEGRRRAWDRHAQFAPVMGFLGTCAGIGVAFHLIENRSTWSAMVISLLVAVATTLLLTLVVGALCFLYERARA
jgi:flagellar motor component MotA